MSHNRLYFLGMGALLCPTLFDPMDCSQLGSSVHGFSRQEYWSGVPLQVGTQVGMVWPSDQLCTPSTMSLKKRTQGQVGKPDTLGLAAPSPAPMVPGLFPQDTSLPSAGKLSQ